MDTTGMAVALGAELAFWRKRRGLTRDEVAAKLDVHPQSVGRWERGDTTPDVPTTWALANLYQVRFADLMRRVEEVAQIDTMDSGEDQDTVAG